MEVYLIRHTKVAVDKTICYGQTDVDLAESFPDELARIKSSHLLPDKVDICYSSPLQRCAKLAKSLALADITYDDRLRELNFGDWEMKKWHELHSPEFEDWTNNYVTKACPNGESYQHLYERIKTFWDELKSNDFEKVLVITHNGCLRASLANFLELPLKNSFSLQVDYGGISKVTLHKNPDYLNIEYINR